MLRLNVDRDDLIEETARRAVIIASMHGEVVEVWCDEVGEVMTVKPGDSISSLVAQWRMMSEMSLRSGKDRRKNPRFLHPYRVYTFVDRRIHPDRRVRALPAVA